MLYEFVTTFREAIIVKARGKLTARPWPPASTAELEHGVPLFLTQLSEMLQAEAAATPSSRADDADAASERRESAIASSAALHGRDLLRLGFTVSQVVHDYGDLCQAVTELALEQRAPITTAEFHTLNRCLDSAIAEAVTEHARITAQSRSVEELERLGQITHEVRDILNTALFAFQALKRGAVAINGSTGAVLGRSLMGLRDFVDSTLSDIRMAGHHQRRERLAVGAFLNHIAEAGSLHAEYRGLRFTSEPVDPVLAVTADPQLLASAVTNLLNNAFKFTPPGGHVVLRTRLEDGRILIEVEDECGGIPEGKGEPFQPFGDRRGKDRSGLGLGLSIARKAVRAHGGDIHIHNIPGKGCVVALEVPLAMEGVPVSDGSHLPSPVAVVAAEPGLTVRAGE